MALKTGIVGAAPLVLATLLSIGLLVNQGFHRLQSLAVSLAPLVALAIYRIFFHGLAAQPGPILNRITVFPLAFYAFKGTKHRYLRALHDRYGDVVRIGPNELSFVSVSALKTIYSVTQGFQKPHSYDLHPMASHGNGLFFSQDRILHRERRRLINRSFSSSALREYRVPIISHVNEFVARILEDMTTKGGPINVERLCSQWAYDTTDALWFGGRAFEKFAPFMQSDNADLPHEAGKALALFDVMQYFPVLFYLLKDLPFSEKYRKLEKISKATSERIKNENLDSNLGISHILTSSDPKEMPLSPRDLELEVETILIGGSDTSHSATTICIYWLVKEKLWRNRIREELDEAFLNEELNSNTSKLDTLPVLNAFIQEALRMSDSFSILPRQAPPGGAYVDGVYVPGGTIVSVPVYPYHLDYRAFGEDAREFKPERWLDPNSLANKNPYMVFGAGAGKCVGMKLAYLELRILLAHVILKLDVEFAKDFDGRRFEDGIRNWRSYEFTYPLNVHATPRSGYSGSEGA